MSASILVVVAMRLRCVYPTDPCEKHDGFRGGKREPDFQTCDPCTARRLAEAIHREAARPA